MSSHSKRFEVFTGDVLQHSCSFCGKAKSEVEEIIAGPAIYICSECVELCAEMLADNREKRAANLAARLDSQKSEGT